MRSQKVAFVVGQLATACHPPAPRSTRPRAANLLSREDVVMGFACIMAAIVVEGIGWSRIKANSRFSASAASAFWRFISGEAWAAA
jgi:hypothetical protein